MEVEGLNKQEGQDSPKSLTRDTFSTGIHSTQ